MFQKRKNIRWWKWFVNMWNGIRIPLKHSKPTVYNAGLSGYVEKIVKIQFVNMNRASTIALVHFSQTNTIEICTWVEMEWIYSEMVTCRIQQSILQRLLCLLCWWSEMKWMCWWWRDGERSRSVECALCFPSKRSSQLSHLPPDEPDLTRKQQGYNGNE